VQAALTDRSGKFRLEDFVRGVLWQLQVVLAGHDGGQDIIGCQLRLILRALENDCKLRF